MTVQQKKTVAVIGGGYWGKNLVRNIYELGALHTVCDLDQVVLEKHRQTYPGVAVTTDSSSIFSNPDILQVVIATPAPTHFSLAKQTLFSGKHVYIEKPMVLDITEGEILVKLAEEKKRILMVGHILQFHPCVMKIQEMIEQGDLGKVQYISSHRLNLGKIQTKESALWALAPHDISVILSLCGGQMPEKVTCHAGEYLSNGVADITLTTMQFAGNIKAHIYASWLSPFKEQKLVVIGSDAMIVFDDTKPWKEKVTLFRNPVTWVDEQTPEENCVESEPVEVVYAEPLKEECRHFLSCCLSGNTPKTSGAEGLQVLQVLEAAEKSLCRKEKIY